MDATDHPNTSGLDATEEGGSGPRRSLRPPQPKKIEDIGESPKAATKRRGRKPGSEPSLKRSKKASAAEPPSIPWVCCETCSKWRIVPQSKFKVLSEKNNPICAEMASDLNCSLDDDESRFASPELVDARLTQLNLLYPTAAKPQAKVTPVPAAARGVPAQQARPVQQIPAPIPGLVSAAQPAVSAVQGNMPLAQGLAGMPKAPAMPAMPVAGLAAGLPGMQGRPYNTPAVPGTSGLGLPGVSNFQGGGRPVGLPAMPAAAGFGTGPGLGFSIPKPLGAMAQPQVAMPPVPMVPTAAKPQSPIAQQGQSIATPGMPSAPGMPAAPADGAKSPTAAKDPLGFTIPSPVKPAPPAGGSPRPSAPSGLGFNLSPAKPAAASPAKPITAAQPSSVAATSPAQAPQAPPGSPAKLAAASPTQASPASSPPGGTLGTGGLGFKLPSPAKPAEAKSSSPRGSSSGTLGFSLPKPSDQQQK